MEDPFNQKNVNKNAFDDVPVGGKNHLKQMNVDN